MGRGGQGEWETISKLVSDGDGPSAPGQGFWVFFGRKGEPLTIFRSESDLAHHPGWTGRSGDLEEGNDKSLQQQFGER